MPKQTITIPANSTSAELTVPTLKPFSVLTDAPVSVEAKHVTASKWIEIDSLRNIDQAAIDIAPTDIIRIRNHSTREARIEINTQ